MACLLVASISKALLGRTSHNMYHIL